MSIEEERKGRYARWFDRGKANKMPYLALEIRIADQKKALFDREDRINKDWNVIAMN